MIPFFKLSGAGNDFLALAEPESDPPPATVAAWCSRGLSLGADGLFVLRRVEGGVRMTHFNADGGHAALCLNGTRCAARLAFHLGWAEESLRIETGAGTVLARAAGGSRVALELPAPRAEREPRELAAAGARCAGRLVDAGVPHFVVEWAGALEEAPVATLGAALRSHPEFGAAGTNVDFVHFTGRRRFEIRSYERGVETETLACGTGVMAAVAAGLAEERLDLPVTALTRGGFELGVSKVAGSEPPAWSLAGDARLLCRGHLLEAAAQIPSRASAVR